MTRPRMLAWCVPLGVLVVVAAGVEGTATFNGPRWVPHFHERPPVQRTLPHVAPVLPKAPPTQPASHLPVGTILMWTMVGVAVVLAVLLVWWWRARAPRRRASRDAPAPAPVAVAEVTAEVEQEPDVPIVRSGIDEALHYLGQDAEPGDAIVRAWLGLQQTAEQSGVARRPSEAPTEFASRILGRVFADDDAITTLLRLYLRARFGDHPVTVADVALVRQALRDLADTWDASTVPPSRRGG